MPHATKRPVQDEEDPTYFYFYETFRNEAAFRIHVQGPIFKRNVPHLAAMFNGEIESIGKGFNITLAET